MATKDLARTVVEGGRTTYSKLDRRLRNRSERRLRFDLHLRDHLLGLLGAGRFPWDGPFLVDPHGILRRRPRRRWGQRDGISPHERRGP